MPDRDHRHRAVALWRKAFVLQMEGKLAEAATTYKASLDVLPTTPAPI